MGQDKKPQLIYIEWCDAISNSEGWKDQEEAICWGENCSWIVKESGFLIKENKQYILLANKMVPGDADSKQLFGILKKIPKPWVIKRVNLEIE